jgi:hypothetical protein
MNNGANEITPPGGAMLVLVVAAFWHPFRMQTASNPLPGVSARGSDPRLPSANPPGWLGGEDP